MASVDIVTAAPHRLTEFEALIAAAPAVLDAIPAAVYICDAEGMIRRYNNRAAELWGRAPRIGETDEKFCGAYRLFRPDGRPLAPAETPMAEALRSGAIAEEMEVVIGQPDGSRRVVAVNIRPLRDAYGRIEGAINCFHDITARKAMEREVEHGRQDLEDFFENSAIGLHVVSREGIILRANRAELDMLGYTAEEYVGRHISDFHADPPVIDDILRRLSEGERLDRHAARLRAKDGSIRHVLITSNGHFRDGRLLSIRCFTLDVTDWRNSEEARRESDERLAATYENAKIGIAEADENGRFVRVNDMLCAITGYSREELLAKTFADLTHPEDVAADMADYRRQVRGEIDRYGIEKRYIRRDGRVLHVEVLSSSVRDCAGRFRYGVRVVQDVTELHQATERQKLLIQELNHRVKNTLATVQSLAAQTARHADSIGGFVKAFEARILALATAHDLLTRRHWEGADLGELIDELLAPYDQAAQRRIEGPWLSITPRTALPLTMALHELATNAAKYGGLADLGGALVVRWDVDSVSGPTPILEIDWMERTEMPVMPPQRRGFGSLLLERLITRELKGQLALHYEPEGLHCRIGIPLESRML